MNAWTLGQNTGWHLISIVAVGLGFMVLARVLRSLLEGQHGRFQSQNRPVAAAAMKALASAVPVISFAVAAHLILGILVIPDRFAPAVKTAGEVLVTVAMVWLAYRLVDVVDAWLQGLASRTKSRLDDMLVPLVRKMLRIAVLILGLAQIAQLLSDKPLTSVVASLGIGGLALALAAQETVKNFFGSLVLLADKPFELGDRIQVDGIDGTVESMGFRSTRIRTLDGHWVTYPNGELANRVIINISRRPFIRRILNVTIPYDTPPEKVARAVEILREIFQNHEGMKPEFPPRIFFNDFNPASLNLQVIYWFHPPDYWTFQAFNEKVNFEILRRFNAEGIEFAFPTQTLFLAGDPRRPLQTITDSAPRV